MTYFHAIECCECKTVFGMNAEDYNAFKKLSENGRFYCPYGHRQYFSREESEADKLRREKDRLKQQLAFKDDEIQRQKDLRECAERSASTYKGHVTRLKNRAKNGVCPCCSRHFENLERHMKTKHPDFDKEQNK